MHFLVALELHHGRTACALHIVQWAEWPIEWPITQEQLIRGYGLHASSLLLPAHASYLLAALHGPPRPVPTISTVTTKV